MRTMDDLPKEAFDTLQMMLWDWARAFPNTPKSVAVEAFLEAYYALAEEAED